jgi:cytochrome c biogenesis protein
VIGGTAAQAGQGGRRQADTGILGPAHHQRRKFSGGNRRGADVRKVDLRESIGFAHGRGQQDVTNKELRNVGPSMATSCATRQARRVSSTTTCCRWTWAMGHAGVPAGCARQPGRAVPLPARACRRQGSVWTALCACASALQDPADAREAVQRYAAQAVDPARGMVSSCAVGARRWRCLPAWRAAKMASHRRAAGRFRVHGANVPEAERARAGEVLVRILNGCCSSWRSSRAKAGGSRWNPGDKFTLAFMTQAVLALRCAVVPGAHGFS